jgi:hypothetical protein
LTVNKPAKTAKNDIFYGMKWLVVWDKALAMRIAKDYYFSKVLIRCRGRSLQGKRKEPHHIECGLFSYPGGFLQFVWVKAAHTDGAGRQ